jgi:hypothetical protein
MRCDDDNACTEDSCDSQTGCSHALILGCTPCTPDTAATRCDDQNGCTTDHCMDGVCAHRPIDDCQRCSTAADCPVSGASCQEAVCTAGRCGEQSVPNCVACADDTVCSDGNGCTLEHCDQGRCVRREMPACVPCASAADCDDHLACTDDTCTPEGTCGHREIEGCVPCTAAADCDDRNACTAERCAPEGSCKITAIPGCTPCTGTDGCDDGDECTRDGCSEGMCKHAEIVNCGPCVAMVEVCGDGMDNDCDSLVDCDDPNCAAAPRCWPETCGDCIDNDGDGKTDYEDSDCCARGITLRASSFKFKAQTKRPWQRLQFKTTFGPVPPASLDPMSGDTSLQIGDRDGQLFCATIESEHWLRIGQRSYGFRKRLADAPAGLAIGRMSLDKRGAALFETQGWIRPLPRPAGDGIHATLRVGGMCIRIVDDSPRGRNGGDDDDDERGGRGSRDDD